jgi:G3E family GTPase
VKITSVFLITGFLGSGKTTFLTQAIRFYNGKKKIGVIQNEFAPANLDGKELIRTVDQKFDLLEINNGSAFCVCLLSDFLSSLEQFITQYQPDILFIEASGLSDPIAVGEILTSEKLIDKVLFSGSVCIVDALNFKKISRMQKRVEHQIRIADKMILNKTDLIEQTEELINTLKKYNPFAKIYSTSFCNVPLNDILAPVTDTEGMKVLKTEMMPKSSGRPDIQSAVLRTTRAFDKEYLKSFLDAAAKITIRIKGYIFTKSTEVYAVQSSFGTYELKPIHSDQQQTELIAMGYDINAKLLSDLYKKYT